MLLHEHYCDDVENFPLEKFLQRGTGRGRKILLVGESPAANGWRKSGKACYTPEGRLLPTGARLNELLTPFQLSVDTCGFTELAKCYVGKDRHLLVDCSRKCYPIFIKQVGMVQCELVILLGVQTLAIFNTISGNTISIGKISEVTLGGRNVRMLPIYHPSPINPHGREKNRLIFRHNRKAFRKII